MTSAALVPEPGLGLRERKKRATRAALQYAALELAVADGLEALTIEAITCRADVSPRTFFNYFATKEDALTSPDPDLLDRLTACLRTRDPSEDPLTSLRAIFLDDADQITAAKEAWRLRMNLAAAHPGLFNAAISANSKVETSLAAVLGENSTSPEEDTRALVAASIAFAVRRSALRTWVRGEFTASFRDVLVECFDDALDVMPRNWDQHPTSS